MKEFGFENKWRKFVVEENLKNHIMSLTANAYKIANEFGVDGEPIVKPGKFGDYTVYFPFNTGAAKAALDVGDTKTLSGMEREASMNRAKQAADEFFEFVKQDGSPVDVGSSGVEEGRTSFMVFLAPA